MRENRTPPTSPWAGPARQRGFTVLELMIVITVTAILLALATPNLRGVMARNQLLGQANEIASAMALARGEAVSRGLRAGVCASADGATCSGQASDWGNFAVVFIDADSSGAFNDGDPVLRSFSAHGNVTQDATVAAYTFLPSGFSALGAAAVIRVCHDTAEESDRCRDVTIQPGGSVTVTNHYVPAS